MKYILFVFAMLYALLSMVAAVYQIKTAERKGTAVMMLCGGALLIWAAGLQLFAWSYDWIVAIIGGTLMCIAAFLNGKQGEQFHLSHHIVRAVFTILLLVGFALL